MLKGWGAMKLTATQRSSEELQVAELARVRSIVNSATEVWRLQLPKGIDSAGRRPCGLERLSYRVLAVVEFAHRVTGGLP